MRSQERALLDPFLVSVGLDMSHELLMNGTVTLNYPESEDVAEFKI